MADPRYDVLGIGNAIVDVIARSEDDFLVSEKLAKGTMHLIDQAQAEALYGKMGPGIEASGGSAANTIAGLASFGAKTAFIGKVAEDELGKTFTHDLRALGTAYDTKPSNDGTATARCLVLVTPDGERTMSTFLGASQGLSPDDVDPALVEASAITYLEGYLWDPPGAKEAFVKAADIAHGAGRQVALSLSDQFCVDRFRAEFLQLLKDGKVDLVFANEGELHSLYETADTDTALDALERDARSAVVTRSEKGAVVLRDGQRISVPAKPIDRIADLTGAGDLFAAGFLYGLSRGMAPDTCARLGAMAAAEVISHVGARPEVRLKDLAAAEGLVKH
ncbi:adenosine kinase [Lutibaculum baratangense]|uniref:Fructokinase n=1 Tax=Lutibaculum baratangense AMV1 TaxID=631454 RepID=V4R2B4_9HYPH|nr:adenosine kinase [Lutibaculum baratangense]ESR26092.1 Fructokinase [Lutibaculum baratangense AMV1]